MNINAGILFNILLLFDSYTCVLNSIDQYFIVHV